MQANNIVDSIHGQEDVLSKMHRFASLQRRCGKDDKSSSPSTSFFRNAARCEGSESKDMALVFFSVYVF